MADSLDELIALREYLSLAASGERLRSHGYHATAEIMASVPTLLDRIEAADKRIEVLEKALEPFANHPEFQAPDDWAVTQMDVGDGDPQPGVTVGDFRAARAALQQKERDDG